MANGLAGKRLCIIHATVFTAQVTQRYADEILSGVKVAHSGDDTIQMANNEAGPGTIPEVNFCKFATRARFLEDYGAGRANVFPARSQARISESNRIASRFAGGVHGLICGASPSSGLAARRSVRSSDTSSIAKASLRS